MNLIPLVATIIRRHIILPCTSSVHGQWISVACSNSGTSAVLGTGLETIVVPNGNPGVIRVHLNSTTQPVEFQTLSGQQAVVSVGDNFFNVVNGDQAFFSMVKRHSACAFLVGTILASGTVYDNSTGDVIDQFSLNF